MCYKSPLLILAAAFAATVTVAEPASNSPPKLIVNTTSRPVYNPSPLGRQLVTVSNSTTLRSLTFEGSGAMYLGDVYPADASTVLSNYLVSASRTRSTLYLPPATLTIRTPIELNNLDYVRIHGLGTVLKAPPATACPVVTNSPIELWVDTVDFGLTRLYTADANRIGLNQEVHISGWRDPRMNGQFLSFNTSQDGTDTWFDYSSGAAYAGTNQIQGRTGPSATIRCVRHAGNELEITTFSAHAFEPGDRVTLAGFLSDYDGTHAIVSVPTPATFTVALPLPVISVRAFTQRPMLTFTDPRYFSVDGVTFDGNYPASGSGRHGEPGLMRVLMTGTSDCQGVRLESCRFTTSPGRLGFVRLQHQIGPYRAPLEILDCELIDHGNAPGIYVDGPWQREKVRDVFFSNGGPAGWSAPIESASGYGAIYLGGVDVLNPAGWLGPAEVASCFGDRGTSGIGVGFGVEGVTVRDSRFRRSWTLEAGVPKHAAAVGTILKFDDVKNSILVHNLVIEESGSNVLYGFALEQSSYLSQAPVRISNVVVDRPLVQMSEAPAAAIPPEVYVDNSVFHVPRGVGNATTAYRIHYSNCHFENVSFFGSLDADFRGCTFVDSGFSVFYGTNLRLFGNSWRNTVDAYAVNVSSANKAFPIYLHLEGNRRLGDKRASFSSGDAPPNSVYVTGDYNPLDTFNSLLGTIDGMTGGNNPWPDRELPTILPDGPTPTIVIGVGPVEFATNVLLSLTVNTVPQDGDTATFTVNGKDYVRTWKDTPSDPKDHWWIGGNPGACAANAVAQLDRTNRLPTRPSLRLSGATVDLGFAPGATAKATVTGGWSEVNAYAGKPGTRGGLYRSSGAGNRITDIVPWAHNLGAITSKTNSVIRLIVEEGDTLVHGSTIVTPSGSDIPGLAVVDLVNVRGTWIVVGP